MIGTPLATPILPVEDNKDVARLTMNQCEMGTNAHKSDHFDLMLLTFNRLRMCMSSALSEIDRPNGTSAPLPGVSSPIPRLFFITRRAI